MRRGLLKEVNAVFDAAVDMCGCGDPERIHEERAKVNQLRREVLAMLRVYRAMFD